MSGDRGEGSKKLSKRGSKLVQVYIDPALDQWIRRIRAHALLDDDDISASSVMRVALRRLQAQGGWKELREALQAEGKPENDQSQW